MIYPDDRMIEDMDYPCDEPYRSQRDDPDMFWKEAQRIKQVHLKEDEPRAKRVGELSRRLKNSKLSGLSRKDVSNLCDLISTPRDGQVIRLYEEWQDSVEKLLRLVLEATNGR